MNEVFEYVAQISCMQYYVDICTYVWGNIVDRSMYSSIPCTLYAVHLYSINAEVKEDQDA